MVGFGSMPRRLNIGTAWRLPPACRPRCFPTCRRTHRPYPQRYCELCLVDNCQLTL